MRKIIAALSLAGVAFSGVLTWRYYQGLCNGGCSIILGLPSCLYGLALFLLLLAFSLLALGDDHYLTAVFWVALVGVLYALVNSVIDLYVCFFCYELILPNCVYGLVVFSLIAWMSQREKIGPRAEK